MFKMFSNKKNQLTETIALLNKRLDALEEPLKEANSKKDEEILRAKRIEESFNNLMNYSEEIALRGYKNEK